MTKYHHFFAAGLTLLVSCFAFALPVMQSAFIAKYPAAASSKLNSCAICHMPMKDSFVNSYGLALKNAKMDFGAIEGLPSAVPGKTNLEQIIALSYPGSQATDAEEFDFPNKMGNVHFNHGAHIMNPLYTISGNCSACHSDDANHFAKTYDPGVLVKAQAHATCVACHKASSDHPNAPVRCTDCHKK